MLYASVFGSLLCAIVFMRSDIVFVVRIVSQYISNLGRDHWETIKWILTYLKDNSSVCLRYGSRIPTLEGFTDSDM